MPRLWTPLFGSVLLCNVVIGSFIREEAQAHQRVLQSSQAPPIQTHTPPSRPQEQPKLHGRFLHITDIHPDEFYQVHASTDEDSACHRGHGPSGFYGAETSDCDSPFSLVNATFDWIDKHLKDKIDFVIWTGDNARHDSDEEIPRSAEQVLGTNRWIASKFSDLFYDDKAKVLTVPVIPTFGNNDILPHNIMMPGPNRWLQYYTELWHNFIPEEQRHSFEFGGWFYVEVIPHKLAVFSLNTLYFFDRNAAIDDCVDPAEPGFKQLEWLRVQLQFMRDRGMKAILMGHVPPARTPSKMLWDETCWQKYTLWVHQFRDVIVGSIYGHMNIDHFMLQDSNEVDVDRMFISDFDGNGIVRTAMSDELTVQSASDYLMELRHGWSKLPKEAAPSSNVISPNDENTNKKRKGKKKKKPQSKLGGPWAERYQLSIVGPSIVPNFFPTLRIIEYNITGLETSSVRQVPIIRPVHTPTALALEELEAFHQLRDLTLIEIEKKKKKKGGKNKKDKKKKPKDPNLVIPNPPSKSSPPGPAYSPQPLTFLGYTQYYANLTHINNDTVTDDSGEVDADRWRHGKHKGKKPDKGPDPLEFRFEEEYSTFKDKVMKLQDLTVSSYIQLAWRMGRREAKAKVFASEADYDNGFDEYDDEDDYYEASEREEQDDDEDEDEDSHDSLLNHKDDGTVGEDKLKKHKKHKKHNKVWLHFLDHAFVSTVNREDLEKLDY